MILNKKFLVFSALALVAGLSVGIVPFYREFSLLKAYSIEVDVVYAYFRTYGVSGNVSGLRNEDLVSYIIVLNITNPTSEIIRIKDLTISFAEFAFGDGNFVQMSNTIVRYVRNFAEYYMDHYWYPNSSRLVAFAATEEISEMGLAALKLGKGYFCIELEGRTQGDAHVRSGFVIKEVTLEIINDYEYVYLSLIHI